ncbi:26242_t:CDS:2 [Gigaspora margarita]|uniref:26242_t:CDS:1 n=1 Tax=Gigaspora margarita TaxID=4874 RepID=A0ABM8VVC2_GIGMA|nr:26242_t:CDS:2 [Gigaspora margarita]
MEELKELLKKTNINYIQLVNHEADDLIASFINQNLKNNPDTTFDIFTRDKDLLQLLNKNVRDNVDNIEGIKGIGSVSAKSLIQQFHAVENIYQKIDSLPENTRNLLENKGEMVCLNKKVISLEKNIPLPVEKYLECDFD